MQVKIITGSAQHVEEKSNAFLKELDAANSPVHDIISSSTAIEGEVYVTVVIPYTPFDMNQVV